MERRGLPLLTILRRVSMGRCRKQRKASTARHRDAAEVRVGQGMPAGPTSGGRAETKLDMPRHQLEVAVGREHGQVVPAAELGEERVDGAGLDAVAVAGVPELRGLDMVGSVGNGQRQGAEALDNQVSTKRPNLAGALRLVVELRIPIEGREGFDDASLLAAGPVLTQRAGDGRGLGTLAADLDSRIEQARVGIEVGRNVQVAQGSAHRQPRRDVAPRTVAPDGRT